LFGLAGTTPDEMMRDLETALSRWQPEWLDVFLITPTPRYVDLHFGGDYDRFWSHHAKFEAVAREQLPRLARKHRYHLEGSQEHYFALSKSQPMWSKLRSSWSQAALNRLNNWTRGTRLEGPLSGFVRRNALIGGGSTEFTYTQVMHRQHRPLNLLGLGYSARSRVFGEAFFSYEDPNNDPLSTGAATYMGREGTIADEARTYLLYTLRDNNDIDRAHFTRLFGGDFTEIIPTALPAWIRLGKATATESRIVLCDEPRAERTRTLMWMYDDQAIEYEICLFRNMDLGSAALSLLLAPLTPGVELAPGIHYAGTADHRILLRDPDDRPVRIRVAPKLEGTLGVELLLETRHAAHADALRQAVRRIRGLMARNGADELGIVARTQRPRPQHPAAI
jgi:hypothetical protein